jgi:uncharacterized protein
MNAPHGLPPPTLARIASVLEGFKEVEEAVLFGSRAKHAHKPGSDIDLALIGAALNWRIVGRVDDALDDLMLPYRFSLVIYDSSTDPEVAAHIARVGVSVFRREALGGTRPTR